MSIFCIKQSPMGIYRDTLIHTDIHFWYTVTFDTFYLVVLGKICSDKLLQQAPFFLPLLLIMVAHDLLSFHPGAECPELILQKVHCLGAPKWGVCSWWPCTVEAGFSQNSSNSRELLLWLVNNHKWRLRKWLFCSLSEGLICSRCQCCWGRLSRKSSKVRLNLGRALPTSTLTTPWSLCRRLDGMIEAWWKLEPWTLILVSKFLFAKFFSSLVN